MGFASALAPNEIHVRKVGAATTDAYRHPRFFSVALYPGVSEYNWIPLVARRLGQLCRQCQVRAPNPHSLASVSPAIHSEHSSGFDRRVRETRAFQSSSADRVSPAIFC
jgi:hypothetical protein